GAAFLEPADDLTADLPGAPRDDRHAVLQGKQILAHARCASQTPLQNSRTQPAPPGRESTQRASDLTSGQASAGTTGQPTARRHSASLTSFPTYAVCSSGTPRSSVRSKTTASLSSTPCTQSAFSLTARAPTIGFGSVDTIRYCTPTSSRRRRPRPSLRENATASSP